MANSIDTMISKGTGMAKGMKARLSGLVGVFKTLAEQHGEASALIERVKSDAEKRAEIWPELRKTLLSHEKAEMRDVYTELREHAETSALADHHDSEADELEKVIKELDSMSLQSAEWGTTFERLATMVIHHATEEEKSIFPTAQEALGEEEAKKLDERFLSTQKRIKDSL